MEYYIDPMWFYLQSISNGIKMASIAGIVILGIAIILLTFYYFDCLEEDEKRVLKLIKRVVVGAIIATILAIAIPSTDTINKMIVSSVVTKENVSKGVEATKDLIDYIVDKINEIE